MIKKTQKSVNLDGQTLWIADCATYTAENILELGTETMWITHAPETVNLRRRTRAASCGHPRRRRMKTEPG